MNRVESLAEKRRKTNIILSLIIVLLLAIIGVFVGYMYVMNDTLETLSKQLPTETSELIDNMKLYNKGKN